MRMSEYIVRETDCGLSTKQEIVGELVRCKDCQWKELCLETLEYKGESGFCSKGERKDDE